MCVGGCINPPFLLLAFLVELIFLFFDLIFHVSAWKFSYLSGNYKQGNFCILGEMIYRLIILAKERCG